MTFKAVGEEKLRILHNAARNFRAGLSRASHMAGESLVAHAKSEMRAQPVPSSPGAHPAVRSGTLIGTVDYEVSGSRFLRFGQGPAMNGNFDYAIGTHEGTSRMAPRPGITNTVNAKQSDVESILGRVTWQKIVGGG